MTEQTMIERVARALCHYDGHPENTRFEGKPMWVSYVEQARLAVAAMREPTSTMIGVGHEAQDVDSGVDAMWRVMVDEALESR